MGPFSEMTSNTTPESEELDDSAPGWDAISQACDQVYPDQPSPLHFGSALPAFLGGPPLQGVSVYRAATPRPHWHYVGYGLTDLYGDQDGPDEEGDSGFGFELTFRLADDEALTGEPPQWPISLLQNLAKYVFSSGNPIHPGHYFNTNGPIEQGSDTTQIGLGFVLDPQLGQIDTPSGRVRFVQATGLTGDDLEDCAAWDTKKLLDLMADATPLWITDMHRPSLRSTPELAATIDEGKVRDGSSTGGQFVDVLGVERNGDEVVITIGAKIVATLGERLLGRLPFHRSFVLSSRDHVLILDSGPETKAQVEDGSTTLWLTATDLATVVATLKPIAGDYIAPEGVRWHVEQTKIKDQEGNVIEVIG